MGKHTTSVRRILMSTDCMGGVWTFSVQLAKALAPYGIEVVLSSMGGSLAPGQQAEALSLRNVMLFQSTHKLEWVSTSSQRLVVNDWYRSKVFTW